MTKRTVEYFCDVCGKKVSKKTELKTYTLPFVSNQSDADGMAMGNHIEFETVELCEDCLLKSTNLRCGFRGEGKRIEFWKE